MLIYPLYPRPPSTALVVFSPPKHPHIRIHPRAEPLYPHTRPYLLHYSNIYKDHIPTRTACSTHTTTHRIAHRMPMALMHTHKSPQNQRFAFNNLLRDMIMKKKSCSSLQQRTRWTKANKSTGKKKVCFDIRTSIKAKSNRLLQQAITTTG